MASAKSQKRIPKKYKDAAPEQIEVQPNSHLYRVMLSNQKRIFRAQLLVLLNNVDAIDIETPKYEMVKLQNRIVADAEMLAEMGRNMITIVEQINEHSDDECRDDE
jgi:hypothetical protein